MTLAEVGELRVEAQRAEAEPQDQAELAAPVASPAVAAMAAVLPGGGAERAALRATAV